MGRPTTRPRLTTTAAAGPTPPLRRAAGNDDRARASDDRRKGPKTTRTDRPPTSSWSWSRRGGPTVTVMTTAGCRRTVTVRLPRADRPGDCWAVTTVPGRPTKTVPVGPWPRADDDPAWAAPAASDDDCRGPGRRC
jgi:hypothetical protein